MSVTRRAHAPCSTTPHHADDRSRERTHMHYSHTRHVPIYSPTTTHLNPHSHSRPSRSHSLRVVRDSSSEPLLQVDLFSSLLPPIHPPLASFSTCQCGTPRSTPCSCAGVEPDAYTPHDRHSIGHTRHAACMRRISMRVGRDAVGNEWNNALVRVYPRSRSLCSCASHMC